MNRGPAPLPALHEVTSLTVTRGRRRLVDDLSFALPPGCFVELMGPNGSGKTSVLRALAGLQALAPGVLPPGWQGEVFLFPDASGFRPELSVASQFEASLRLAGAAPDRQAGTELLAQVGVAQHAHLPVGQLSHGQVRRLMLAVMAASRRRVWLVDEPFNALDAQALDLFRELVLAHLHAGGAAIIATHRSVSEALPELEAHRAGRVELDGRTAFLRPAAPIVLTPQTADRTAAAPAPEGWGALAWVLRREFALLAARPQDAAWPSVFFWMAVSLFPFGLGTGFLPQAAAGVFWVSALFTMLIVTGRVFEADFACGALAQMRVAGLPLPALVAGKLLANWVAVGLPVAAASLLLGLQYGLPGSLLGLLAVSLALGMASLSAMACLFAALGLMARQSQAVSSLLALPLFVPLVIFGSAVLTAGQAGAGVAAPLLVLAGLAGVSVLAVPFVAARLLALALE